MISAKSFKECDLTRRILVRVDVSPHKAAFAEILWNERKKDTIKLDDKKLINMVWMISDQHMKLVLFEENYVHQQLVAEGMTGKG